MFVWPRCHSVQEPQALNTAIVTAAWTGRDACLGPRKGNRGTEAINHLPVAEGKESLWAVSLSGCRAGQYFPAFVSHVLASVDKRPTPKSQCVAEGHVGVCLVLAWTC